MIDAKKEESKKIIEIKDLVILLASGAFAKLHRKFLSPSVEKFPDDHWLNWAHHSFHSIIGIAIQVVLFLWVAKFIIAAWKAMVREIKERGK